jgi:hypothetical protein
MTKHPPRTTPSPAGDGTTSRDGELSEFADVFRVLDAVDAPPLDAGSLQRIRSGVRKGLVTHAAADLPATAQPAVPSFWQRLAWTGAALTLAASAAFLALVGSFTGGALFLASVVAILAGVAIVAIAPPRPAASLGAALGGLAVLLAFTQTGSGPPHHDLGCAVVEWMIVAAPMVAALVRSRVRGDGSVGSVAAAAAGAGLSAAGVAGIVCPDHSLGHLALVHGGGVLATVVVAAVLAWLVVPARHAART